MRAAPQFCPTPRELDDLELMFHGVTGAPRFGGADHPFTLRVPPAVADQGQDEIDLVDPEGVPLARVTVEATYPADGFTGIIGAVHALQHNEFGAFRALYVGPEQVQAEHPDDALTVPVTAPLANADVDKIREVADGRHVILLALTGHGTPTYAGRPMSGSALVRATLMASTLLDNSDVVAVPLASRGAGQEDADDDLLDQVARAYAPLDVLRVSGDGPLPRAVADVVEQEFPSPQEQGLVLFFTGLSGSGKSTIARALYDVILERGSRTITSLDGDVVRRNLSAGLTFSREDRETNIKRIGWVAAEISRHRGIAICSPIAPFDSTRQAVRQMVAEAGGAFFLIHVATPLEECERRDRKGLYAKARRGEIREFTGISSPYEQPEDADVRVDTTGRSIEDALGDVLAALDKAGYLPAAPGAPS